MSTSLALATTDATGKPRIIPAVDPYRHYIEHVRMYTLLFMSKYLGKLVQWEILLFNHT